MALLSPNNSRDKALQALNSRSVLNNNNFIALITQYYEFTYTTNLTTASPLTIEIFAELSGGVLKGTVTFRVTGLVAGTNLTTNGNTLILNPSQLAGNSVTIFAELNFNGTIYTSRDITVSKRYANLLTRLTRTSDNLLAESNGTGYRLPTDTNTLELFNGTEKVTSGVTFGIVGTNNSYIVLDGLRLAIDQNTGVITLSTAVEDGWSTDLVVFNLTATYNLVNYRATYTISKVRRNTPVSDRTAPLINTGDFNTTSVKVTTGITSVFVELPKLPNYTGVLQTNLHDLTIVYAAQYTTEAEKTSKVFENSKELGRFGGTFGSITVDAGSKWKIWLKFRSIFEVLSTTEIGPFYAETAANITSLVDAMTGPGRPFTVLTEPKTYAGVTYPAGTTFASQSFIIDGQIENAKIADATIDSAKIKNIKADKIEAGTIKSGQIISSTGYVRGSAGWAINGDGTAEFAATTIRGQLTANQINSRGLTIRDDAGIVVLDAGKTIQDQIPRYAPGATSGTCINFDPSCSNPRAWEPAYIKTIIDGVTGTSVLRGGLGEFLVEGLFDTTRDINTAFRFPIDRLKRYQISGLIRKVEPPGNPLAVTSKVHLGLLEFDGNNAARYDWSGFLYGTVSASEITNQFQRFYVYIPPGGLNSKAVTAALHVILARGNNSTAKVEIQDLRVDDITLPYNVHIATANTAASDSTKKSTDALNTSKGYTDTTVGTAVTNINDTITNINNTLGGRVTTLSGETVKNNAATIINNTDFLICTKDFKNPDKETGIGIYNGGIVAQKGKSKNRVTGAVEPNYTFAITNEGNAQFKGTLTITNDQASRITISNQRIQVWQDDVRRVVIGNLNEDSTDI